MLICIHSIFFIGFFLFESAHSVKNEIVIENIGVCPNNDKNRYPLRNVTFQRLNMTHYAWNFKVNFLDDIDDKIWMHIIVERWANGRWVNFPFMNSQKNACATFLKFFPDLWIGLTTNMQVKHPDKCPIPKGEYALKNFICKLDNFPYPVLKGRFRGTVVWTGTKELENYYMCFMTIVNTMEKM